MSKRNDRYLAYFPTLLTKRKRVENIASSSSSTNVQIDEQPVGLLVDQYHQEEIRPPTSEEIDENLNDNDTSTNIVETNQRISLDDSKSLISLVAPKFKIMLLVDSVLNYIRNPLNVLQCDDQVPFFEGSHVSKGIWTRAFNNICNKHLLTAQAEQDILTLIYNTMGHVANLPVSLTNDGKKRLREKIIGVTDEKDDLADNIHNQNVISNAKKYARKGSRWIAINQCQNDCCVYVGRLTGQFACPTCSSPRFRPCSRATCDRKGKEDCAHLINAMDGVAYKSLHYRLLVPLITDLVNTKYFVASLHYHNECMHPGHDNFYTDILDGSVAKEHLQSMDNNYKAWCNERAENLDSIPINLLLSQFYDGGQLFKWATCSFWGLFTSILNLPPTYRGKVGISTFLSAIYGGQHTTAETFLFTDLYCEELRSLYVGFQYIGINGQLYFIQARLMLHSMDTKAMEPVFKMQSMTGSRFGCPYCRSAHGQNNSWTTFFSGNRQYLPLRHYLRFFGQSGKCCPHGYYSEEGDYFTVENFMSSDTPIQAENLIRSRNNHMTFCEPCDKDPGRFEEIRAFLREEDSAYEWHHRDPGLDFKDFSGDKEGIRDLIFYRHFDFRPQKEHIRITKEEHLEAALKARNRNKQRKRKDYFFEDGFFDVWPFERLPYADLPNNSTFPPEHAIKGVVERCFDFVFGLYKERQSSKRVYKTKRKVNDDGTSIIPTTVAFFPIYRPSYHHGNPPYSGTSKEIKKCQVWLLCVLVPVGISDRSDWILNINQPGTFKINQWKILISVYWEFILTVLEGMNQFYRKFFHMVAQAIRKLLSFSIAKTFVKQLQKEMNEMICIWESLFPESPPFVLHQLMELVSSIPLFGSQHSWSELFGEQALGLLKVIKKKTNPGGLSYERYIMERSVNRELDTMESFYSKAVNETNKNAANSTVKVSFDSAKKELSFKVMQFGIFNAENTHSTFCPEEINHFVKLCLQEVMKRYDDSEDSCVENSCLYRLVISMQKQYNGNRRIINYYVFLKKVTDITNSDLDLFSQDEVLLAKALISFQPTFHSNAWIYGLLFQSRGSKFREHALGDGRIDWKDKSNYSSWCRFPLAGQSYRYGKLNGYFEVVIGDKSIDGLLVASVTSHRHKPHEGPKLVDYVSHNGSMDPSILFIALQDIYPTRITTIPFGDNDLPIKVFRSTKKTIVDSNFVNDPRKQQLSYSCMFQMDADKVSRMPLKRPCTMYLSASDASKSATKCATKCANKFSIRSLKADGKIRIVAKMSSSIDEEIVADNKFSNQSSQLLQKPTFLSPSIEDDPLRISNTQIIHSKPKSTPFSEKNVVPTSSNPPPQKNTYISSVVNNGMIRIQPKNNPSSKLFEKNLNTRLSKKSVSVGEVLAEVLKE